MHALLYSGPLTLQQATANPCLRRRLLDTHRLAWVSLLWGHCSFFLGFGAHKGLFVPSKSLFPQSCVSSGGSMVGLVGDLLQEGLLPFPSPADHTQVCCTQSPCPCGRPLLTHTSAGDTQTQFWLSLCGVGVHFVPFPGLISSGDQVLGECTVSGGPCILITSPSWPLGVPGVPQKHRLRRAVGLLCRANLRLQSSWLLDLRKMWLAAGRLLTVW